MHPCDAAIPMDFGAFVPWIPYPFWFSPIQRVPSGFSAPGGTTCPGQ